MTPDIPPDHQADELLGRLLAAPQFSLPPCEKAALLLPLLDGLTARHYRDCPPYRRLLDMLHGGHVPARSLHEVPALPVGLFKTHHLASVPDEAVHAVLTSSGTSGAVSRVVLDAETAALQTRALAAVMTRLLGPRRLPMMIVDHRGTLTGGLSARAAGVLGMMTFGRDHRFVLEDDLSFDEAQAGALLDRAAGGPFLIFGFTALVWRHFLPAAARLGLDLSAGILVHGGGWKTLADQAVDNATFKATLRRETGLSRIHNMYGMAEQVGAVFLEGEDGLLHASNLSEIVIRDPDSWEPVAPGGQGVIQVLSALPRSYPGHSLLTEDVGVLHALDCADGVDGWRGTAFTVTGRLPRAELRGCGDTAGRRAP